MSIRQYWVAYDLSDDRERARIERCIARYGQRLQKSVFVCVLDVQRRSQLLGDLAALRCDSGFVAMAALADAQDLITVGKTGCLPSEDWVFGVPSALEQPPEMLRGDT